MANPCEIAQTLFGDGRQKPGCTLPPVHRQVGQHGESRQRNGVVADAGTDQQVAVGAHAVRHFFAEDRVEVGANDQPGAAAGNELRPEVARFVNGRLEAFVRPPALEYLGAPLFVKRRTGYLR